MKKTTSLRWRILFYILFFNAGLFALLWLFQTVFLDRFYENIRMKQIDRVSEVIAQNVNNTDNLAVIMQEQAQNNEACIRLISPSTTQSLIAGNPLSCKVNNLTDQQISLYLDKALKINGSYIEKIDSRTTYQTIFGPITRRDSENYDLISARLAWGINRFNKTRSPILVLVSGRMTPVNATVSTLRVQLFYIGGILILMTLIMSYKITSRIVKPLEKITESARILATGNYDVKFNGTGYKEINELSDTMNYASKKLKEVDQMRRDLVANVSHDLRTPLTMISGYGEMMRDLPEENNAENAQVIIDESQRLTTLVNDLLDLNKLQAGQIEIHPEKFDLTECLFSTCHRYKPILDSESLELEFTADEHIFVNANPSRIQQVLDNLINNAIHYGIKGKRIVLRQINKGNKVRIEVQDYGEGIPEEKLDLIWDRYYKIDKQHVRSTTGSGIGLSIVKEILLIHHAEFGVHSKIDEGSIFYFELPVENS